MSSANRDSFISSCTNKLPFFSFCLVLPINCFFLFFFFNNNPYFASKETEEQKSEQSECHTVLEKVLNKFLKQKEPVSSSTL